MGTTSAALDPHLQLNSCCFTRLDSVKTQACIFFCCIDPVSCSGLVNEIMKGTKLTEVLVQMEQSYTTNLNQVVAVLWMQRSSFYWTFELNTSMVQSV
ncbi:hypothetical protein CRG98_045904 [Punica granatum]|uniref:Uncharacterized protein n=1 Tax=Punica granatum TaxID=22663 RepID=A0A2I0HPT3_PUNGR|nr:hypothetical protein CRG98_045904 [Punica granatum]